jgi:hypothetical protein
MRLPIPAAARPPPMPPAAWIATISPYASPLPCKAVRTNGAKRVPTWASDPGSAPASVARRPYLGGTGPAPRPPIAAD